MPEPRWVRPLARVFLVIVTAFWVTASLSRLARWATIESLDQAACRCVTKAGSLVCALCSIEPPLWASGLVGVLGVLAAYVAARLTRPRPL